MADVEDPARILAPSVPHRCLDRRPGPHPYVPLLLEHPVVEEGGRAIVLRLHGDEPRQVGSGVISLGQPASGSDDLLRFERFGHDERHSRDQSGALSIGIKLLQVGAW
ncbi:MAG: hypothetical protein ACJ8E0_07300 [Sphingomicrobium sp.]